MPESLQTDARCILAPLVPLTSPHWCVACQLDLDLRAELATTALLRAEVSRLNADKTRLSGQLIEEREAHLVTKRVLARTEYSLIRALESEAA
jgi:hypothetical protein